MNSHVYDTEEDDIEMDTDMIVGNQDDNQSKSSNSSEALMGDIVLANSITHMRDAMLHYEFTHAIASGDIGCSAAKYSNELLELACNFKFEYHEELKTAIKNNWLMNLTRHPGTWFPMDLGQEHNIKQLKTMVDRHNKSFDDPFFANIVSTAIVTFIITKRLVPETVGLSKHSETHGTHQSGGISRALHRMMAQVEPHIFHEGHTFGFEAKDDFSEGYNKLTTDKNSRLQIFLTHTLHNPMEVQEQGKEPNIESTEEPPMPAVLLDGSLYCNITEEGGDQGLESDSIDEGGESNANYSDRE
ncbi:hypothetical protein BS47DRAFT_1465748 [Hydnum rufescens UP504]|uniref:DUF6589 domain-containing protein n=1 Tax=Hydnum rufescens UP504 TaxID=1448309 RepID=A0A9P6DSM9_9AGAM|nr:hypothetical protein BS47DRAFT_1465748 [Hydnum rufescens UP504]